MAKGPMKSQGETINHFNGVLLRVSGDGELQINVYALDDANADPSVAPVETPIPYTMTEGPSRQPTILLNARQQRVSLEFKVTEINEYFEIGRILLFRKRLFAGYVGRG